MPTPKSIKKQAALANKIHAEVYTTKPAVDETPVIVPEGEVAPVVDVIAPVVDTAKPTVVPEGEVAPVVDVIAPADKKTSTDDDGWQHKYNVINGKYKAEVPRLHQQIRELQAEATARIAAAAITQPEKPNPGPTEPLVTEEEIKEYGQDLIGVIGRASRESMNPEVEALKAQIASMQESLAGMSEKSSQNTRDRLLSDLTASVPEWEDQNNDPLFMDWLSQQDPFSGMQRHQMLDAAFKKNDTARVINFFKGYLTENGITQQPVAVKQERTPQVDLADSAAPGKSRGTPPAQKGNKRIWTQSDVSRFYRDIQRGVFKNKDAEKKSLEKDIIAAAQEGRLVA